MNGKTNEPAAKSPFGHFSRELRISHPNATRLFWLLWAFIAVVSVYDGYLVHFHRETISFMEENPVGQYLLTIDNGDPNLLLRFKACGTLLALLLMVALFLRSRRFAFPVVRAVAFFQCVLLGYLVIGSPIEVVAENWERYQQEVEAADVASQDDEDFGDQESRDDQTDDDEMSGEDESIEDPETSGYHSPLPWDLH